MVSTGDTVLSGDLGVSPGTAISGFPPGIVDGDTHAGDAAAASAQADLVTAYDEVDGRTPDTDFVGDLNGRTFHAGIHHTAAALALTGTLTLDAEGNADAVFIFQVDAALNTAAGSHVVLSNGAQASNVFWQVQGAAGVGAGRLHLLRHHPRLRSHHPRRQHPAHRVRPVLRHRDPRQQHRQFQLSGGRPRASRRRMSRHPGLADHVVTPVV